MILEAFSFPFMWWAIAVSLVLAGIHAYLGFHVIARGVIFVDLALAQMAALGVAIAIFFDLHEHPVANYLLPVGMTLLGAIVFAWLRHFERRVPLEAFIGIVFAVAQASALLILGQTASGTEHLKETLIGTIFTVAPATVIKTAVIYSAVGALHFFLRKPLFEITRSSTDAAARGRNVFWWDVLFYATFGIVVTSSVRIAGVLLVFGLLVIPSVAGVLSSARTGVRLAIGWIFACVGSTIGLLSAFALDTAAAPTILIVLALSLVLHSVVLAFSKIRSKE